MSHLKTTENILHNLLGLGLTAKIRAQELALLEVGIDSSVDLGRGLLLVEELEHERSRAEGSDGVGDALALDVRGRAVAGLTDGEALANVGGGDETERADESSGAVGEDVAVKVGGDDDVVGLGLAEELVNHGVDNLLLDGDRGEAAGGEGLAGGDAEEAIGLGQDVGLVGDGHEGALVDGRGTALADLLAAESDLTGDGGNARRGALRGALDGLGDLASGVS